MEPLLSLPIPVQAQLNEVVAALGGSSGQFIMIVRVDEGTARVVTNIEPRVFVADVLRQILDRETN